MFKLNRKAFLLPALLVVTLLAACSNPAITAGPTTTTATTTLVGAVANTNLALGIASDPEGIVAYACDSERIGEWFHLPNPGSAPFDLTGTAGTHLHLAVWTPTEASGTLTLPGGRPQPFKLAPATDDAGIYRAQGTLAGVEYVGGWVLLNDDQQRGVVVEVDRGTNSTTSVTFDPDVGPVEIPNKVSSASTKLRRILCHAKHEATSLTH